MPDQYKSLNITNADIEFSKKYQAAIDELIRKHQLAVNDLTERQLAEALRQAIACGDFQRHVCPSNSSQAVIYIPHAREAYLTGRIRELEEQLREVLKSQASECSKVSDHDPEPDQKLDFRAEDYAP